LLYDKLSHIFFYNWISEEFARMDVQFNGKCMHRDRLKNAPSFPGSLQAAVLPPRRVQVDGMV